MDRSENECLLYVAIKSVKNRLTWVAAIALICAIISFLVSAYLITPEYTAVATFFVQPEAGNADTETIIGSACLLAKSDIVLDNVREQLGIEITDNELKNCISSEFVDYTTVLKVKVTHTDPDFAEAVANSIAMSLPSVAPVELSGTQITVIGTANHPDEKTYPNIPMNVIIGAVSGVIIAMAVFMIKDENARKYIGKMPDNKS